MKLRSNRNQLGWSSTTCLAIVVSLSLGCSRGPRPPVTPDEVDFGPFEGLTLAEFREASHFAGRIHGPHRLLREAYQREFAEAGEEHSDYLRECREAGRRPTKGYDQRNKPRFMLEELLRLTSDKPGEESIEPYLIEAFHNTTFDPVTGLVLEEIEPLDESQQGQGLSYEEAREQGLFDGGGYQGPP